MHRLPDLIVLPSYPIVFVLLFVPTVATGQWGALLRAVLVGRSWSDLGGKRRVADVLQPDVAGI